MSVRLFRFVRLSVGVLLLSAGFSFFPSPFGVRGQEALTPDERNNIEVFRDSQKSVVFVTLSVKVMDFGNHFSDRQAGTGTGFVWDRSGLIVTNYHVIESGGEISIRMHDLSVYKAEIVGLAPSKDLALLKIDAPREKLFPVKLGSSSSLRVGNKVLAIGNPFGFDQTLTVGVVSALGREIASPNGRTITGVLQTDAAINPGNSGGPLLNSAGRVVGIATAIFSSSGSSAGIGFGIPIDTVKKIVPSLKKHGKINRPVIGINILEDNIARRFGIEGVVVTGVSAKHDAYAKGLRGIEQKQDGTIVIGDVIVAVNGKTVKDSDDLFAILEEKKAGDYIVLETDFRDTRKKYRIRLYAAE